MDFCEFMQIIKRLKDRQEEEVKYELRKVQLLIQAIHTSDPQDMLHKIENQLQYNSDDHDRGDLDSLKRLQASRGGA